MPKSQSVHAPTHSHSDRPQISGGGHATHTPKRAKRVLRQYIIGWTAVVLIVIVAVAFMALMPDQTTDPAEVAAQEQSDLAERIGATGSIRGPIVYVGAQALQSVVAPIPGPVIAMAGGFLYGGFIATVLALVGSLIGYTIVFFIAKKVGRPLLKRFIGARRLAKYERVVAARGGLFLYIAFLTPALPDSIAGYAAGASAMSIPKLLLIATIGRLPIIVMAAYTGSAAAAANYAITVAGLAFFVITAIVFYMYREPFEKWLLKK